MSAPHTFAPEKRPADCWDWLSREDATAHALAAFEMARRECFAPAGQQFRDPDGCTWAGRDTFADLLAECFALRIKAMAHGYGLGDFAADAERLTLWGQRGNACAPAQEGAAP